jgi:hypothetical protein
VNTLEVLRKVAAHGVAGAAAGHGAVSLPAAEVQALLAEAGHQKLVGLLDQAVADGLVVCDDVAAQAIGERAVDVAGWCLLVERHLLVVHDLLDGVGIPHLFLKGATISHRFYEHAALRTFADVDVLVPGDRIGDAVSALVGAGHSRRHPELHPGYAARFGKSVTMRSTGAIEVDLHRTLAPGPFGLAGSPDLLWGHQASVAIAGRAVPTLDAVAALVHACVHEATSAAPELAGLRDIAALLTSRPDPAAVHELAAALRVEACMQDAMASLARGFGTQPPDGLDQWNVPRDQQRWLAAYAAPDRTFRSLAIAGVRAVPTVRGKAAYAFSLIRGLRVVRPRTEGSS